MVAISSQQPAIVTQNSNTVPASELRAVPQQEKSVNNQDNSVSASQATQVAKNQQAPQPEQPAEPTQAVSQAEQQLQRAAVEASATTPQPQVTPPENREVNQQPNVETRQTENRQQVADDSTVEASAPPPENPQPSSSASSSAALSTYQQVGNLGNEQPRRPDTDTPVATSSSTTQPATQTPVSSSTSEEQESTPERQVFGGAIDAPRQ